MLGRPYSLGGIVVRGDGRGRGLGWPTANLAVDNELLPADGVYVTRLHIAALGESLPSVTNVGTRPTVYAEHPRRGRVPRPGLRPATSTASGSSWRSSTACGPSEKFPSVEALRQQIGQDATGGARILGDRQLLTTTKRGGRSRSPRAQ